MSSTARHPYPPTSSFDGAGLDCGSGLLLLIRQHIDPLRDGELLEIRADVLIALCREHPHVVDSLGRFYRQRLLANTMAQERPVLPAPHQVVAELWDTTVAKPITSKRSLVYHAWITLSATLLGFALGTTSASFSRC